MWNKHDPILPFLHLAYKTMFTEDYSSRNGQETVLEHIDMSTECDSRVRSLSDLCSPYETGGKKDSAVSDETEA